MKTICTVAILFCSTALIAQTTPAKTPAGTAPPQKGTATTKRATSGSAAAKSAQKSPTAEEGPGTVVATIHGLCPTANTPPAECTKKITRAEFDRMVNLVSPQMPPSRRREVAALYIQMLAMANEAQKAGVDKDPAFEERLRLEKLRLLAENASERMRQSIHPTQQEIDKFYADNHDRLEEFQVRFLTIPKTIDKEMKAEETKAIAAKLRDRAVAGEDMDKLQGEAYVATKAPGAPPSTNVGWRGRGRLGPHESEILKLPVGQVSTVFEDAQNFYVYKVDAKHQIPLETVKKEIEEAIVRQRLEASMNQLLSGVKADLDEKYFGQPQEPTPAPVKK